MKFTFQRIAQFDGVHCVFLDRDGVINRKAPEGKYVYDPEDFEILPGVEASIAKLNRRQCRVFVVTNQRGVALGLYTAEDVDALHNWLQQHLSAHGAHVDGFYYCPHDEGQCSCRKPALGLFERAMHDFPEIAAANSVVIGDSLSDIAAAQNFGCRSIFVRGDAQTRKAGAERAESLADAVVESLPQAIDIVLRS